MFICIFPRCKGHDDDLVTLLHGQQHLARGQAAILRALHRISTTEGAIMADVDQLSADFDTYKGDVASRLGDLKTTVQELKDEIANSGTVVPPAVQAKIDALDASVLDADAALNTDDTTPTGDQGTGDEPTPAEPTPAEPTEDNTTF